MEKKKSYLFTYMGAVFLMPVYLFIVSAHLFFSPGFQNGANLNANSFIKKDTQSIYFFIRNDRSTYSEKKNEVTTPRGQSFEAIPSLAFSDFSPKTVKPSRHINQPHPYYHHVYLTFRVLRI